MNPSSLFVSVRFTQDRISSWFGASEQEIGKTAGRSAAGEPAIEGEGCRNRELRRCWNRKLATSPPKLPKVASLLPSQAIFS